MSANTRPPNRPTMTKRNMRSFFPEPFLPLPLSSGGRHNTKWKVYNAFLADRASDPRCNKRRHSFSPVPSFLACSISLSLSLAHIIMKEGKHFLLLARSLQLPLSPCRGRVVGLFVPSPGKLCHSTREAFVASSCQLSQIVASVNHAFDLPFLPRRPAGLLLRRRSSYLSASAPPTLIRSPFSSLRDVWFGAFVVVHHHVGE